MKEQLKTPFEADSDAEEPSPCHSLAKHCKFLVLGEDASGLHCKAKSARKAVKQACAMGKRKRLRPAGSEAPKESG